MHDRRSIIQLCGVTCSELQSLHTKVHSNDTTDGVLTNLSSGPDWAGLQRQPVAKRHRMAQAVKLIKRCWCIWHPCHLHSEFHQHNCSMVVMM